MRIIETAVNRSRTVIAVLVLLFISGTVTYITIPKEAEPDVDIPFIFISTFLQGISPEDAERLIVRPLEEELRSIEGIKEMTANAYEGGGNVILEFTAGFDADLAVQNVREAVDRAKPELPEEAEEPTVMEINTSIFPVLVVTLSGDVPERALVRLARNLRDKIETIPSVLDVTISGDREEVVEIVVDPLLVESYGLNGAEVAAFLGRSNRLVAAGNLDTGEGRFAIKVPGLFETAADVFNMPIRAEGDAVVRFRDIAMVKRTFKDPDGFARVNGLPAIAMEITKRTGENIIDTIEIVRALVEEERAFWPPTVQVDYTQDNSEFIRKMLHDLENHVVSAIVLVMIVLIGVLGLRSALLVGIAIPGSFLTAIVVLGILGFTVNMVVLFALIFSVGMLVDGAIIVSEYADRKMAEGLERRQAYVAASKRMAIPIVSATATTLAAFLPLLFWPGVVGEFMKYFPITVLITLSASLLMALIFLPVLGSYFGKLGATSEQQVRNLVAGESGDLKEITGAARWYLQLLKTALRHPGQVLLLSTVALIGAWYAYANYGKGLEFFPEVESDFAIVLVHARGNLSIHQQDALVREVEQQILNMRDEFDSVYTRTGSSSSMWLDVTEDVIGQITIELKDWDKRRPAHDILTDIRQRTQHLAGIVIETRVPEHGPPVGKPVQLQLSSRFPELLPPAVEHVRDHLESMEGLKDIDDDRAIPGIEWKVDVDRAQAAKFGLDVSAIGDSIKLVTNGLKLGTYRPDDSDDEIDINIRYPEQWRTVDQLDQVRIVTPNGAVPISNFISRSANPKVGTIKRVDGNRVLTARADILPGVLADDKVKQIRSWLAQNSLDPKVQYEFKGQDEEQKAAQAFLTKAFFIALFIMAIILVTQFNNFYHAFLILSAVIMSTVGALIGLLMTGQAFGIVVAGIGMIALAGVVVNDNIVLVDTYNQLKQTAKTPMEAIMRTGVLRLRPVILTTITTVLGLLPMFLKTNVDLVAREVEMGAPITQWWYSMATVIIFGLSFATILTLIITPCALMLQVKIHEWRQNRQRQSQAAAQ
ncbi:efflux RND transporter permease subunit [Kaarinaea lacus]